MYDWIGPLAGQLFHGPRLCPCPGLLHRDTALLLIDSIKLQSAQLFMLLLNVSGELCEDLDHSLLSSAPPLSSRALPALSSFPREIVRACLFQSDSQRGARGGAEHPLNYGEGKIMEH